MSHTKVGPDRFSRFDVYWVQTDRQTDKLNLYIDAKCLFWPKITTKTIGKMVLILVNIIRIGKVQFAESTKIRF